MGKLMVCFVLMEYRNRTVMPVTGYKCPYTQSQLRSSDNRCTIDKTILYKHVNTKGQRLPYLLVVPAIQK